MAKKENCEDQLKSSFFNNEMPDNAKTSTPISESNHQPDRLPSSKRASGSLGAELNLADDLKDNSEATGRRYILISKTEQANEPQNREA